MEKLLKIQAELKAPKNQRNNFGKYNYRSCEDILEAVKPLLKKYNCTITLTDAVYEVCGLPIIEASATILDIETKDTINVTAQAGIDTNRKGMDVAQSFGASSSYARKYALNGLLLIDDTKDSDNTNKVESFSDDEIKAGISACVTPEELTEVWKKASAKQQTSLRELFVTKGKEIKEGLF